ncbi:hypothetical protein fHeYen902_315c [Yersinia phage fHe-Yen9-02]|nr:hypothetical protein fHeYen902_315c [Yersinia phage fHe-Yen9-02]
MRILGHNCLPLSIPHMPSSWASSPSVEFNAVAFFFQGSIPSTVPDEILDYRMLWNNAEAVVSLSLRPTATGHLLDINRTYGVKALSGSVYNAKRGLTLHYPKSTDLRDIGAGTGMSSQTITNAYTTSLAAGNRALFGTTYPAFRFLGNPESGSGSQLAQGVADLTYDQSITVDAVSAIEPVASITTAGGAIRVGAGAESPVSIVAGADAAIVATPITGSVIRLRQISGRRITLASQGDHSTTARSVQLGYALVLIQDTGMNLTASGSRDCRIFACDVGGPGSNAFIQLESTSISTGEYPAIQNILTGTEAV